MKKKHKVANYLRKRYGYCKDKNFQVGCICCEVSRVIRYLEGHKQRVSNVMQQRLMAHDCPDHKYPDVSTILTPAGVTYGCKGDAGSPADALGDDFDDDSDQGNLA